MFKAGRGQRTQRSHQFIDYREIPKVNEGYQRYYDGLGIIEDQEKDAFWAALRRELPNSFRFTCSKG